MTEKYQSRVVRLAPSMLSPYFFTLQMSETKIMLQLYDRETYAEKSSAGYTPLWKLS
jgi:hypothetical protein